MTTTASPASAAPHTAAVVYVHVGTNLYVNTLRSSRKARDSAQNPNVSVCIPIRRLPIGPPATVQFGALATLLAPDDAEIAACIDAGGFNADPLHASGITDVGPFPVPFPAPFRPGSTPTSMEPRA